MPSFIGGDTYRAYQIGNKEGRYAEAASTVLMDRITGFVGAALFGLIFAVLNYKVIWQHNILILCYALLLISFVVDIVIAQVRNVGFLRKIVLRLAPEKIINLIHELRLYHKSSHTIGKAVALGGLFSAVGVALANYILFWALGIEVGFLNYMSVIFLITVVSAIPVSINNIGLKEWAYITFFGLFGVNPAQVITVAILSRFLQMLLSFFSFPMYWKSRK